MGNMRFKVGDRVRIKSIDWYNENKNEYGIVELSTRDFVPEMVEHCGTIVTIDNVFEDVDNNVVYHMEKNVIWDWTDEMIEGLVEEETKPEPKFKKGDCVKCSDGSCGIIVTCDWSDSLNCYQYYIDYIGTLDAGYQPEKDLQPHTITTMNGREIFEGAKWKHEFECPDGYQFVDENGNVINATKIVLEKKKKEYPKTYEECIKILGGASVIDIITYYYGKQLKTLYKLIICRDAYWKIAGEEMGLGKPWKPDWSDEDETKWVIYNLQNKIKLATREVVNAILAFPTEEMRDTFYENFKSDIETVKELL